MFNMFKSVVRQTPQVSPTTSIQPTHRPETTTAPTQKPNLMTRKSEADLLKFLHRERRMSERQFVEDDKENLWLSDEHSQPPFKSALKSVDSNRRSVFNKTVQFDPSEQHAPEKDPDFNNHCVEVLHYMFSELRAKKVPVAIKEIIRTMQYFTTELLDFIQKIEMCDVDEEDYATRLVYVLRSYQDYVEVTPCKQKIAISRKALSSLDDSWIFVDGLLQKAAHEVILCTLKNSSGSMSRPALRRAVSVRFPYMASKVLSRATAFEDMASKSKMLLVINDTVVLKGSNKMDTPRSSNDGIRKRSTSVADLGDYKQHKQYAFEEVPRKKSYAQTPGQDLSARETMKKSYSPTWMTPTAFSTPKVGLRPHGVPLDDAKPKLNVTVASLKTTNVWDQSASSKQSGNYHKGPSAFVEQFVELRKPSTQQLQQTRSNEPLRKPHSTKPPNIETRILNHGRRCICDVDLKTVFHGVGEATFDDFAAQHLRCLISIVKKHVIGLDIEVSKDKEQTGLRRENGKIDASSVIIEAKNFEDNSPTVNNASDSGNDSSMITNE